MAGEHIAPKGRVRLSDEQTLPLVDHVLAGDSRAFEGLVRLCEGYVYSTCFSITGNVEDAEDAMQETFLKIYTHLKTFRRESRFSTWLTRIAINEALHRLRKRRPTESLDEPVEGDEGAMPRQIEDWHPDPEQIYASEQVRRFVEQAIQGLPVAYRVVFVLRDVDGLGAVEVAEALGLTIAAVKSRLLRARLMVRESLAARLQQPASMRSRLLRARSMMAMMLQMAGERMGGLFRR